MTTVVDKIKKDFKIECSTRSDFALFKREMESKGIHVTFISNPSDRAEDITVFRCLNCRGRRSLIREKVRGKVDNDSIYILISGTSTDRYSYNVCKVSKVYIVCPRCSVVYSTSGHVCERVFKPVPMRSIKSVFKKVLAVDLFYDIETYLGQGDKFVPGLVAFTYHCHLINANNPPADEIHNEISSLLPCCIREMHEILIHNELNVVPLPSPDKYCYYFYDGQLDEKDDIMLSFVNIIELLLKYLIEKIKFPLDVRMSLISFNGNKFDDFFFFKSLVKKRTFNGLSMKYCSILERSSKLLCISYLFLDKTDEKRKNKVSFRTHDLRNFLSTGSLSSNAQKFQIPCGKTLFPHSLITKLSRGQCAPILSEFPDFEYFEEVIRIDMCKCGKRGGCIQCKKEVYEESKREHGSGEYDLMKLWYTYCCNDVYVTECLYYTFMNTLKELFSPLYQYSIDPSSKLTLPSLTNALAYLKTCEDKDSKLLCTPISDALSHCFKAIYGGHCQTTLIGEVPQPEEYIFFDFNGEYSGLMECPLPCGEVQIISSSEARQLQLEVSEKWSSNVPQAHFEDLYPFVVKCVLRGPNEPHLVFDLPNVPERDINGCLAWNFCTKKGVYSSVDIFVAVHYYGFALEIIDDRNNLRFATWKPLLRDYVKFCQNLKNAGKVEKNPAKENVGKLMGNALYGYQIKKPDNEKVEYIENEPEFTQLRLQESAGYIKIHSASPFSDIINPRSKPAFVISKSHLEPWDDGLSLAMYSTDSGDEEEDYVPDPSEYPVFVKYSTTEAFKMDSNTLPQIGVFVLSFSRLLNSQLYFECFLQDFEKRIPIDSRDPVVLYTDTDSFLIKKSRMRGAKWVGNKNVTYNLESRSFEPWGKNELSFEPCKILIGGKKLYMVLGPNGEMKTAAKGVDRDELTIEKFTKLVNSEKVTFEQKSFKKNFDTYDITCTSIRRELGLGTIAMKPIHVNEKYVLYRPFYDQDEDCEAHDLRTTSLNVT